MNNLGQWTRPRLARLVCPSLSLLALVGCDRAPATTAQSRALTPSSDPLQFEAASDWHTTQGHARNLAITGVRSQGAGALAVEAPSGHIRLESNPLSSTNPRLASMDLGAKLLLDFQLPTEQPDQLWPGSIQMFVTARSRQVFNVPLGEVELGGMRTGMFGTLRFSVPDAVATALKGATYDDLTFAISVHLPKVAKGSYIFDNLRLKGGRLPPPPTTVGQIAGGASVLLEASKTYGPPASNPAAQGFPAGVIQIPQSFHVLQGQTGTGSATFEFKIGGNAPVACQYAAATANTYAFASCAGAAQAGDLVPADFVRLTIVDGDATAGKTKIKAQIALNPVGDELPVGLPAIPTFFGTTGAEVRDALDAFVQAQRNWQIDDAEIVKLPTPAIPIGFPVTRNGNVIVTPPADNDPPFSLSSRLTGSDLADAGWHVTGSVAAPVDAAGNRDTHFDVDIGADVWLLTANVNDIIGVNGSVDTHTPAFDGHTVKPTTSHATFCYRYFGFAQACAGPFDGSTGLDQPIVDISPTITFFSLDYWVFHIGSSASLHIKADVTGGFTPNGFSLAFDPQLRLGVRVEGGLSAGPFVGAGLFADFTLIDIDAPISASVNTTLNSSPYVCAIHVAETLSGTATISSGGGALGYYIQGGLCCGCFIDVCWRDEGNLFSWNAFSTSFDILPATPLANQDIPLPPALCTPTGNANGGITYPVVGESFSPGDFSFLSADFTRTFVDTGVPLQLPTSIDCREYVWSSDGPGDIISPTVAIGGGSTPACYVKIHYGSPGVRTISVSVNDAKLGAGADSRQVTVLSGDPATAPVVTLLAPAPFTTNGGGCGSVPGSGTASDPKSLAVDLEWFTATSFSSGLPTLTSVGTGSTTAVPQPATLVRLVGTNSAGQKAAMEVPINLFCVK